MFEHDLLTGQKYSLLRFIVSICSGTVSQ